MNKAIFGLCMGLAVVSGMVAKTGNIVLDSLAAQEDLSILRELIGRGSFADVTSRPQFVTFPFTFLAPSNEAFKKAGDLGTDPRKLKSVLAFHVLNETLYTQQVVEQGGKTRMAVSNLIDDWYVQLGANKRQMIGLRQTERGIEIVDGTYRKGEEYPRIIRSDTKAGNGVIHVIDKVLTFPQPISTVLESSEEFSELRSQLQRSNLGSVLEVAQGVTLFASDNAGFASSGISGQTPVEELVSVLGKSIVPGTALYSSMIVPGTSYQTNNANYKAQIDLGDNGAVIVGGSKVLRADIIVKNGVIHRVDKPILA
ncbi:hypothetical protein BB561_005657 [Smittium simulii]|uniref:FAS1 domain-containing protein n=1 Tax=Smittium simulii TaxID=133385 RepID=A0A2T9Y999_9FUNG|nr:hypothetical protein BB561_005657 [Smittium simulii]